jgi:hypothetical protein
MTWQTIDSGPRDDSEVIAWDGGNYPGGCRIDSFDAKDFTPDYVEYLTSIGKEPTWSWWLSHWQPIPAPDDPAWQSMRTAPKDGKQILVRAGGYNADIQPHVIVWWGDGSEWGDDPEDLKWRWLGICYGRPAAWTPLPEEPPPTDEIERIVSAAFEYAHGRSFKGPYQTVMLDVT